MSLRSFLSLGNSMSIETYVEKWNGRVYIGFDGTTSMMCDSHKALRRFLKLPLKTPSREKLDAWLAGFEPADTAGVQPEPQQLAATGFGPEHHGDELDPTDPNHATRMVT